MHPTILAVDSMEDTENIEEKTEEVHVISSALPPIISSVLPPIDMEKVKSFKLISTEFEIIDKAYLMIRLKSYPRSTYEIQFF